LGKHHSDHHHNKVAGGAGISFFDPKTSAYERGAIGTSTLRTIQINPDELEHTEDAARGAEIVRDYLEKKLPGVTRGVSMGLLGEVYGHARNSGPFASNTILKEPGTGAEMCLTNAPDTSYAHGEPILEKLGIAGNPDEGTGFDSRHLRDLPGSAEVLAEMIGIHEGEHCNQIHDGTDMGVLEKEILADRTALGRLRERGETDTARAWVDVRALSAANGDALHATGIFLEEERFEGINKDILDAAKGFKDEMVADVATRLSLSKDDAEKLRLDNPRAFRDEIEKSLAEGRFDNTGNKYTKRYIEAYSGAVDRLFVEKTPPLERAKATPVSDPDIEVRTLEEAEAEDARLAEEARELKAADEAEMLEADSEDPDEDPHVDGDLDDEAPAPVVGEEANALFSNLMKGQTVASLGSVSPSAAPSSTPHVPAEQSASTKPQAMTV
jgi:hypothetical protein